MIDVQSRLLVRVLLISILLNLSFTGASASDSPGCATCDPEYINKCSEKLGNYYNMSYCCCSNNISCVLPAYSENHTIMGGPNSVGAISISIFNNDNASNINILISPSHSKTQFDGDVRSMNGTLLRIWAHSFTSSPPAPRNITIDDKQGMIMKGNDASIAIYYPTPEKQVRIKIEDLDSDYSNKLIETWKVNDQACE